MGNLTLKNLGRWNVRIVRKNDRYGLADCLVHEESDPPIEYPIVLSVCRVLEFYRTSRHGCFVSGQTAINKKVR